MPTGELAARLAEAYRLIGELTAQAEELSAQNRRLAARVEQLERQAGKDSLLTEQRSVFSAVKRG